MHPLGLHHRFSVPPIPLMEPLQHSLHPKYVVRMKEVLLSRALLVRLTERNRYQHKNLTDVTGIEGRTDVFEVILIEKQRALW